MGKKYGYSQKRRPIRAYDKFNTDISRVKEYNDQINFNNDKWNLPYQGEKKIKNQL